jgi:hypothetical protein
MPGFFRRNSAEEGIKSSKSCLTPSPAPRSANTAITFIPAMIDGSCWTSPAMHKKTPMQAIFYEMRIMAQNMRCIPEMMGSLLSLKMARNMFRSWIDVRDICLQVILATTEMWMLVMVLPAFLTMPGLPFMVLCCICACAIAMLAWPLKGDQVITSAGKGQQTDQFADERWIYINSIMIRYRPSQNPPNDANRPIATTKCDPISYNYHQSSAAQ